MNKNLVSSSFNKDTKLITVDEILQLLADYNIGRKPLSKLLGWGDTTILHYLDGELPMNEYSDKLFHIVKDPSYYYDLLTANSCKITELAYRKSLTAVLKKMIGTRITITAQYIINRAMGDITAKRVQAILYYAQSFSLALYGQALFEEDYLITQNLIPYPSIYNSMRQNGIRSIDLPANVLTANEQNLIDSIYNTLDWYGPEAIRIITARERAYLYKNRSNTNQDIILKESLCSYFTTLSKQYHVTKPSEINNYFNKRINGILSTKKRD